MQRDSRFVLDKIMQLKKLEKKRSSSIGLSPTEEEELKSLKSELRTAIAESEAKKLIDGGSGGKRQSAVPQTLKASFKDVEAFQGAYLKNVSGGGLYINTDKSFVKDAIVKVDVEVQEPKKKSFSFKGSVVWVNPMPSEDSVFKPGIGVKFGDMERADQWTMYELTHKNAKRDKAEDQAETEEGGKPAQTRESAVSGVRLSASPLGPRGSTGGAGSSATGARFAVAQANGLVDKIVQSIKKILKK